MATRSARQFEAIAARYYHSATSSSSAGQGRQAEPASNSHSQNMSQRRIASRRLRRAMKKFALRLGFPAPRTMSCPGVRRSPAGRSGNNIGAEEVRSLVPVDTISGGCERSRGTSRQIASFPISRDMGDGPHARSSVSQGGCCPHHSRVKWVISGQREIAVPDRPPLSRCSRISQRARRWSAPRLLRRLRPEAMAWPEPPDVTAPRAMRGANRSPAKGLRAWSL